MFEDLKSDNSQITAAKSRPQIIFIRHGLTDWNAEGRYQGQIDIPLNDIGKQQARRNGYVLGEFLEHRGRSADDYQWVASPMTRTRQTMDLVRSVLELPEGEYAQDDQLVEITFGEWEGRTNVEIAERDPEGVAQRKADKWGFTPPGGESYETASKRVKSWLDGVELPTIVVSHGGINRLLRGLMFSIPDTIVPEMAVPQDQFLICDQGSGMWL